MCLQCPKRIEFRSPKQMRVAHDNLGSGLEVLQYQYLGNIWGCFQLTHQRSKGNCFSVQLSEPKSKTTQNKSKQKQTKPKQNNAKQSRTKQNKVSFCCALQSQTAPPLTAPFRKPMLNRLCRHSFPQRSSPILQRKDHRSMTPNVLLPNYHLPTSSHEPPIATAIAAACKHATPKLLPLAAFLKRHHLRLAVRFQFRHQVSPSAWPFQDAGTTVWVNVVPNVMLSEQVIRQDCNCVISCWF